MSGWCFSNFLHMTFALNFVGDDICVWQKSPREWVVLCGAFFDLNLYHVATLKMCRVCWVWAVGSLCCNPDKSFETPRIARPLSGSVVLMNKYRSSPFFVFCNDTWLRYLTMWLFWSFCMIKWTWCLDIVHFFLNLLLHAEYKNITKPALHHFGFISK